MMVTLCHLPNDILLEILTQHGCSERDIYAFSQVNHRLHAIAKRCLYRKNASENGSSALLWASRTGNLATALYALEHRGADIESKTSIDHRGPLLLASRQGHLAIVQLLLSKGADPNATDTLYQTALVAAVANGHEKIAKLLIHTPTCNIDSEDDRGETALEYAAEWGREAIVQLLIDKAADLNHQDGSGFTALTMAARLGHATIARLSLRHGADPNLANHPLGRLSLHQAAQFGHEAVVQALLEDDRTNAGLEDRTPLYVASAFGHCGVVKLLLARDDIDVNPEGLARWRPIHWAAFDGSVSLVRLFLEDPRIDVNAQERRGWPALFFAVQRGHRTTVEDLLSHPMIDPKITDRAGGTALMLANQFGRRDIAALIEASCKEKENTNNMAQS